MRILSIETSCDETSVAIVEGNRRKVRILSNIVSSQINIHKKYGGVVPEVAARNHILNIIPVIDKALREAKHIPVSSPEKAAKQKVDKALRETVGIVRDKRADSRLNDPITSLKGGYIDLIAVTGGPGLMSSLLIGTQTAETLAYVRKKPLLVINHIEAHIYANWLEPISIIPNSQFPVFLFPALALVVSGGHTQLVLMSDHLKYRTIGQTRDDAAGEAFDKVAKILGLGYPGGPIISKMAERYCRDAAMLRLYDEEKIKLPRPMIDSDNFDFSFSGLKTAVLYLMRNMEREGIFKKTPPQPSPLRGGNTPSFEEGVRGRLCAEFQQAVIDVLVFKTIKAAKKYKVNSVLLAGGVAANKALRMQMADATMKELGKKVAFHVPEQILCTDNAAMVGVAAYYRYLAKPHSAKVPPCGIKVDPNWRV